MIKTIQLLNYMEIQLIFEALQAWHPLPNHWVEIQNFNSIVVEGHLWATILQKFAEF